MIEEVVRTLAVVAVIVATLAVILRGVGEGRFRLQKHVPHRRRAHREEDSTPAWWH